MRGCPLAAAVQGTVGRREAKLISAQKSISGSHKNMTFKGCVVDVQMRYMQG